MESGEGNSGGELKSIVVSVSEREIEEELYDYTLEGKWEDVVKIYGEHADKGVQSKSLTSSKDTALHVAVKDGQEDAVVKLVQVIEKKESLEIKNEGGDTPLHCAASRGSQKMCECILQKYKSQTNMDDLIKGRNDKGETPLYLAARYGHKDAFLYLHSQGPKDDKTLCRRTIDGDTILHSTIRRDFFDLAFQIIHLYENLVSSLDEKGISPLHILADKPSAFKSSSNFRWYNRCLYECIFVEPLVLNIAICTTSSHPQLPKNYAACQDFIKFTCFGVKKGRETDAENPRDEGEGEGIVSDKKSCNEFFMSAWDHIAGFVITVVGTVLPCIEIWKEARKKKEKHVWSNQILKALWERPNSKAYVGGGSGSKPEEVTLMDDPSQDHTLPYNISWPRKHDQKQQTGTGTGNEKEKVGEKLEVDKRETALMVAAKNGVMEIVEKILVQKPTAIHETNSEHQNILHMAVKYRQPHVFEFLRKRYEDKLWNNLIGSVDKDDNTVLHLAAKLSKYKPWHIPGAAMQMQWEIKWFLYIKELMPGYTLFISNNKSETPAQIFVEDHKELVKEGGEWLKSTSESCSVVAALIAGVAFATSGSIPGGTEDSTGKPLLENRPAFNVFALTSLFALGFSITALIMFLAILTSRHQPRDFRQDIPCRLLIGLSSLFLSIVSILASFSSSFFFLLRGDLHRAIPPLYAVACLPVTFYAFVQLPLYLDLIRAICKPTPQSSNRESEKLIL